MLGQPVISRVRDFLQQSGVDVVELWQDVPIGMATAAEVPPADTTEIDLKETCGIRLRFKRAYLLAELERFGSEYIFSGITYYAEGEDSTAKGFVGELPFGLSFADSETMVLGKVGQPSNQHGANADGTYFYHRWHLRDYILQAVFISDSKQLRRVIAYLPLK
jgi:hypothetical protein